MDGGGGGNKTRGSFNESGSTLGSMAIASATAMCVPATLLANSTPRNCVNHRERDKRLGIRSSVKYTLCSVKSLPARRVWSKT